jgi:hypothetical protein
MVTCSYIGFKYFATRSIIRRQVMQHPDVENIISAFAVAEEENVVTLGVMKDDEDEDESDG